MLGSPIRTSALLLKINISKFLFYNLRYFGYTNTCAIHMVYTCAVYLACTPCQSLNMVSLSLSGFDEAKELQFRNSLDETCTVTSQGTAHSQMDVQD